MVTDFIFETAFYESHEREVLRMCNYIETKMSDTLGAEFRVVEVEPIEPASFLKIFKMKRSRIVYELIESD